ncbi:MAG TPA: DNA-directed RNA polymerase subunit omega [Planctomycetota bacterium]|jgi:DNA-directed RNA polymerase subunit omega|nr:DNA-directed RNA polymerase subunit omega [Planctomycetota bacterium]
MIEGVMDKSEIDALAEKFGGRFKLTVLIQKRVKELVKGAARLVETDHKNLIDVALEEIRQGKLQWEGMLDEETERKPRKKE